MTWQTLILIMTFAGSPFLGFIIAILTWWIRKPVQSSKPVETKNGKHILTEIENMKDEQHKVNDHIIEIDEKYKSVMRELKSLNIEIAATNKRLDALMLEFAKKGTK